MEVKYINFLVLPCCDGKDKLDRGQPHDGCIDVIVIDAELLCEAMCY